MSIREDVVVVSRMLENDGKDYEGATREVKRPKNICIKLYFTILSVFYCLKMVVLGGDNLSYQPYVGRFFEESE